MKKGHGMPCPYGIALSQTRAYLPFPLLLGQGGQDVRVVGYRGQSLETPGRLLIPPSPAFRS